MSIVINFLYAINMKEKKKLMIKEKIKSLFVWRGVSMTKAVKLLNQTKSKQLSVSNFSHKLANETIKFSEVIEIADLLGYDVTFKPRPNWESTSFLDKKV